MAIAATEGQLAQWRPALIAADDEVDEPHSSRATLLGAAGQAKAQTALLGQARSRDTGFIA
jgi:hypothetical protein